MRWWRHGCKLVPNCMMAKQRVTSGGEILHYNWRCNVDIHSVFDVNRQGRRMKQNKSLKVFVMDPVMPNNDSSN